MQRREFLGSAAAIGLTPIADAAEEETDLLVETNDDQGRGRASVPVRSPVWSAFEIGEIDTDDTSINVKGYWYEDREPEVELSIGGEQASVFLNMSPERAREFAADLELAAMRAELGNEPESHAE